MTKEEMLRLRLEGYTYRRIAKEAGVSRQRVHQLISPPKAIRVFVVAKYGGACNRCGIFVGQSGHVHHNGDLDIENYNDPNNLELLCLGCHRKAHSPIPEKLSRTALAQQLVVNMKELRANLGLTQEALARELGVAVQTIRYWEKGKGKPNGMARRLIKELYGIEIKEG